MRASVHIKVPKLTMGGSDKKARAICKPLGLSVRGLGGEHTPIGADGTIDLSPSARFIITEVRPPPELPPSQDPPPELPLSSVPGKPLPRTDVAAATAARTDHAAHSNFTP